jgi:hypothetical protein
MEAGSFIVSFKSVKSAMSDVVIATLGIKVVSCNKDTGGGTYRDTQTIGQFFFHVICFDYTHMQQC